MRVITSTQILDSGQPEPTIAAWITNYATRYNSMAAWLAMVETHIAEAHRQGARIFLMPEYVSEAWLGFATPEETLPSSKLWQAQQAEIFIKSIQAMAPKYDMLIVAGSMLMQESATEWRNRAPIIMPDGTVYYQDKLHLMPDEREIDKLGTADDFHLITWNGIKIVVCICLDTQITRNFVELVKQEPDLILIPSMTIYEAGFNRIFTCAAARAVEMHCPVVVVGGVGTFDYRGEPEPNTSGAALFTPCEISMGMNGKKQMIGPFAALQEPDGLLFVAHDVPVHTCRAARQAQACDAWNMDNHLKPVGVMS